MTDFFSELKAKLKGRKRKVVLPEGKDLRVLQAASRLHVEKIVKPILLGNDADIRQIANAADIEIAGVSIIDPQEISYYEELVDVFVARMNGAVDFERACELLQDVNYFGAMLVYVGRADGLVSGPTNSVADALRPALQIIQTKKGISKKSGAFIMIKGEEKLIFADCTSNVAPTSQDLAEIAIETAKTAKSFGLIPRVAMLSFSTKGSFITPETEKVAEAVKIANTLAPEIIIDGELQFDAAYVPDIAAKKTVDSVIHGDANVFIFPSLESGDIGYKLTERLGGYEAIGPILQGLNAPVNSLSRSCSADDVYKLSLITAAQSL
ncbi:phosphate acetyltransferase [Sporosarcina sp. FA9]|uniref:phosphate acetyltransferase n=1 Tax=Sporosarcina sp. FA9 TaxID=3413030 RepID=UPI003F65F390